MAKWIQNVPNGLSREELLSIHSSMRDQRNKHRSALFTQLQFYLTIISALLTVGVTLSIFAIPYIINNIQIIPARLGMFALLLVFPLGVLMMLRYSLQNLRREYQKLMEYLTVEQKMEAALGLLQTMRVADPLPDRMPYPDDTTVLFPRWVDGTFEYQTSSEFVKNMVERTAVFYTPLKNTLWLLFWIDVALIVGIVGIAIGTSQL